MNMGNPMRFTCLVVVTVLALAWPSRARAQDPERFDVSVHLTTATIRELNSTDLGVSGRAGWRPVPLVGIEGEVGFYPADIPERRTITSSRTEFAFGVTVGPRLGRIRPFGRVRSGLLSLGEAPGPVACILIYPPPLACTLAGGGSFFMLDFGGGVEMDASRRTFLRFDIGDRLTRYPGPSIARGQTVHEEGFFGHDLRVAVGAGWRF